MKTQLKNCRLSLLLCSALFFSISTNAATYGLYSDNSQQETQKYKNPTDSIMLDYTKAIQQQLLAESKAKYQQALELIKQKEYTQANKKLDQLIEKEPQKVAFHNLKAMIAVFTKDFGAAKQSFDRTIQLDSSNLLAHTMLAKIALDKKDYQKAKELANKTIAIDPSSINSYKVLADIAMQQQGVEAAEKILTESLPNVKENPATELAIIQMLAKVYRPENRGEKLLLLTKNLLARHPDYLPALSYLADVYIFMQDFAGSEKTLRRIILQNPKDGKHLLLLARLLGAQNGKEAEAIKLLESAEHYLKNPALALSLKTEIYIELKHYQKALDEALKIIQSYPGQSIGLLLKGKALQAQKKYNQALTAYQAAYLKTASKISMDAILKILSAQKKDQEIMQFLQDEYSKHPDNGLIQMRLANIYQKVGKYQDAIKLFKKLLSRSPNEPLILNNLAWAYSGIKNKEKALEASKKAYQIMPNNSSIADTYGYFLLIDGANKEALAVLEPAALNSPQIQEIQLHYAQTLLANKQVQKAKKILQQLANNKSHVQAFAKKLLVQETTSLNDK